ncbi:MAG: FtsX-like permease family protein [Cytophagales bacterium]|nr:FtsX-like permease family protein [Cytophagales bacterium]
MELIPLISLGLLLGLFFAALRQKQFALASMWFIFSLSQATFLPSPVLSQWMLLVLPIGFRFYLLQFFQKPLKWPRELINVLPFLLLVIASFLVTGYQILILKFAFTWETWRSLRLLTSTYRQKGISTFGNGSKINWINALTFFQLVLLAFFWLEVPLAFLTVLVLVFVLISSWHFAKESSFESFAATTKYAKSTLLTPDKARLLDTLEIELKSGTYFLQPDASLKGLAKLLGTSSHNLSQLLNESKGVSFFELQASVRVREAKKMLQDPQMQHLKIEEIANQVGYASKSSFNTTFKKITGNTPSEYRDSDVRFDKVERSPDVFEPGIQGHKDTFELLKHASIMLTGFFKIYYRNLLRNKAFSFINLFGLVLGFTSILLVWVYLRFELSYDQFHKDADNTYRVAILNSSPQTRTPHPLAQAMVDEFSQVEAAVSLSPIYGPGLTLQDNFIRNPREDEWIKQPGGFYADSTFFDVFDFKLTVGNPKEALSGVGHVVISESLAQKFYGDENPLGKAIEAGTSGFKGVINGVFEDPPANSHFHPQFLVSYMTIKSMNPDDFWFKWDDSGHFNYVKLQEGANPKVIEAAFPDLYLKYDLINQDIYERWKEGGTYLGLQPMTSIHLNSDIRWELEQNSNMTYIYILLGAIVFIVVITCINFVNLSTARVVERGKEIGIRKTLGARQLAVSSQFTMESVFSCLLASILSFLLALLLFEEFSALAGRDIPLTYLTDPTLIFTFWGLVLLVGLITGIYPAISVTRIKSSEILKGKLANQSSGLFLRRSLVAIQFCVSAMLIFGSLVIFSQIDFLENKALGFDADELIVVKIHTEQVEDQLEAVKQQMRTIPGVIGAGGVSSLPGSQFNRNSLFTEDQPDNRVSCSELRVDYDALPLLGVLLKEGRYFEPSRGTDSLGTSYLINEAALTQFQVDNIFEKTVLWDEEAGMSRGKVVGVIEDFHYKSLHEPIRPLAIKINPDALNYLLIKVEAGTSIPQVLAAIEDVYLDFETQFTFEYQFLDQSLENVYQSDRQAFAVFNLFTTIALILSVLGLSGLAYLLISQKTKEIGIRKVMGAKLTDILWYESRTFLIGSVISLVVGLPLAYFLMNFWLENFAYQISIGLFPFGLTILIVLILVVLCVALSVIRTSLRNPSQALRYE